MSEPIPTGYIQISGSISEDEYKQIVQWQKTTVMTPTPAQIEAAAKALYYGHNPWMPLSEETANAMARVALTAAAGVGKYRDDGLIPSVKNPGQPMTNEEYQDIATKQFHEQTKDEVECAIEEIALFADTLARQCKGEPQGVAYAQARYREVAAAIRAFKDK